MIKNFVSKNKRITFALSLISIGVILRIIFHNNLPGPPPIYITLNGITLPMFYFDLFFMVAMISLLSAIILGGYYIFIIPISIMAISDVIIGQTWILLFVWSGFAIIGLIGYLMKRKQLLSIKRAPTILGLGIGSILIYDLWTNFGVWLGWYPHNIAGLTMCFTLAIPFMLWHLLSTTIAMLIILLPIVYLKENKLVIPEFTIKPFEQPLPLIALLVLMISAVITTIV